ncbi:MAG: T9SS type A sorting domain-containing protein [Ginsengibacter sp.]
MKKLQEKKIWNIIAVSLVFVLFTCGSLQAQNDNTAFNINPVREVNFHKANILDNYGNAYLSLYPNPVINEANVTFNAVKYNALYEVRIVNNTGIQLRAIQGHTLRGVNVLKLNVGDFAPGIYYLEISTATNKETLKFIK